MLTINLLPKEDHRIPLSTLAVGSIELIMFSLTVVLIIGSIWLQNAVSNVSTQISKYEPQQDQNAQSKSKSAELQQHLVNILDRQEIWQKNELLSGHFGLLLEKISLAKPDKLQLTKITNQKADEIVITGNASSRTDINDFIKSLNSIENLIEVTLGQANILSNGVNFTLTAKIKKVSSPSANPTPTNLNPEEKQ